MRTHLLKRLLLFFALLLPAPVAAQSLAGSWALRHDGAVIMRFDLEQDGDGWKGTWTKPDSFASDGKRFGRISLPAVQIESRRGAAIGDWAELAFDDPEAGEEPQVFRFRLTASGRVEMIYVGTDLAPFTLQSVPATAQLGPFEEGRIYGGEPAAPAVEGR